MNRLLKTKEVAEILGCSESTVYSWAAQGIIPCYKFNGKSVRFDSKEIEDWVRNNRHQPGDAEEQADRIIRSIEQEVDIDAIVSNAIESVN